MSFTEFCCRSGGSNLNAGTRTGDSTEPGTAASFTYASGTWVASTGVFTLASGNPTSDGVTVGDFASVYADGSTVTGFVGRVTARSTTTITVSLTAVAGTPPANGTSNRTLKIGGAWKGPNGTENFPFGFLLSTLTNSTGNPPRVNFKNDATYNITASMVHSNAGPDAFQGYTTAYADGGRATFDGGTSGASYVLLNLSSNVQHTLYDLIFQNNGASGSANGVTAIRETVFKRCAFANIRGNGLAVTQSTTVAVECEAYVCNQSNTSSFGGFQTTAQMTFVRCVARDNAGSNSSGFALSSNGCQLIGCVADNNGQFGILAGGQLIEVINCDLYNNVSHGISLASTGEAFIENCNFVKNGGYGVGASGSNTRPIEISNCGFGSGTQVNTSGQVDTTNMIAANVSGSITYASGDTPWVGADRGDFRQKNGPRLGEDSIGHYFVGALNRL